ncbi:ABC transporter permease [Erysipelothrix urinaevulpis]|uniref:ABC transporter permease n=1 Tax=Erysipelothrix urinaevulpis TaxID=2683717 RepID=UPI00135A0810|nr:ABC transporter permease [Erysipelothrix urinaevulpis]
MKTLINKIRHSSLFTISIVLVILVIATSIISPYFLTPYNLQALIRDLAFIGMIGVAQSLTLLVGELDLSVGKIASLSGVVGAILMTSMGLNPYLSILIAILLGTFLGFVNGTIITKLKLNAMVATIGMTGVYGGINLVITKGKAISNIPQQIHFLGKGNILGIPIPFIFTLIVLGIILFIVFKTKTGRYIYAIGNNKEAADLLGVNVDKIRVQIYMIVGTISALAGILYVARLGSAQTAIGENWPMNSIASSVIGGVALTGGIGNPAGALLGATIISVIQNMIVLFGVNIYWQTAVSGIVVVAAISFSSIALMRKNKITGGKEK